MTIRSFAAALAAFAALGFTVGPALAHHGWSEYDRNKPLKLSGTVTAVSYANPHATIRLDVDGKSWLAVLAPPARMSSRGIAAEDIKVGTKATVEGFPNKQDAGEMRAERVTLEGKVYELR